jgi:hypothetical protein
MALFPEQLNGLFTDAQLRGLQSPRIDSLVRARRIAGMLRSRLPDRVQQTLRERRKR